MLLWLNFSGRYAVGGYSLGLRGAEYIGNLFFCVYRNLFFVSIEMFSQYLWEGLQDRAGSKSKGP